MSQVIHKHDRLSEPTLPADTERSGVAIDQIPSFNFRVLSSLCQDKSFWTWFVIGFLVVSGIVNELKLKEALKAAEQASATTVAPQLSTTDAVIGRWTHYYYSEWEYDFLTKVAKSAEWEVVDVRPDGTFEVRERRGDLGPDADTFKWWYELVHEGQWSAVSTDPRVVRLKVESSRKVDGSDDDTDDKSIYWKAGTENLYSVTHGDGQALSLKKDRRVKHYDRLSYTSKPPWEKSGATFLQAFTETKKVSEDVTPAPKSDPNRPQMRVENALLGKWCRSTQEIGQIEGLTVRTEHKGNDVTAFNHDGTYTTLLRAGTRDLGCVGFDRWYEIEASGTWRVISEEDRTFGLTQKHFVIINCVGYSDDEESWKEWHAITGKERTRSLLFGDGAGLSFQDEDKGRPVRHYQRVDDDEAAPWVTNGNVYLTPFETDKRRVFKCTSSHGKGIH